MQLLELLASSVSGFEYLIIFFLLLLGALGLLLMDEVALFVGGYLSFIGFTDLKLVVLVGIAGSVIGGSLAFWIGRSQGNRFLKWWFKLLHIPYYRLVKLERYFEQHGAKSVLLSKFTIISRVLAPLMAGMFKMPHEKFEAYNIAGAILWVPFMTMLGFYIGRYLQNSSELTLVIVITVIALTMLAVLHRIYARIKDYA
jgi:membrane-associated protein